ncbi:hypothetical protein OU798_10550 [Prolixibacteraceae bacterium Z1-6]|uniref:Uncharacterized protein n=1 Tax=Draconibacterium aestuarii TaxID=2998507 RepID=A0A9X3F558_9BACT|nr:hypothetical protein [Prolixibacteraceae bacterium Z1-6]
MHQQKHLIITVIMLTGFGLLAKAQSSAVAPLEGGTYTYTCNGISVDAEYNFYVSANADGSGVYDDILTGEFDFIGNTTGSIGEDGIATTQILWNDGASVNNYQVWLEVSIAGCSNSIRLEVAPQQNNRIGEFEITASTDCFNVSDNSFTSVFTALDNNGQLLSAVYFPLLVEFDLNGVNHTQKVEYDNRNIRVHEDWFALDPTVDTDVTIELKSITDRDGIPVKPGTNATHTRTIFALPEIQFTEALRRKYRLNYEELTAYIISGTDRL